MTLCRRTMRLMASSHPSGVVRIQEIRDILLLPSLAWQPPHLLTTSALLTGKPFSPGDWAGLAAAGGESCDKSERAENKSHAARSRAIVDRCSELRRSSRAIAILSGRTIFGGSDGER